MALAARGDACSRTRMSLADQFLTHAVENQATSLQPYDAYGADVPLKEALHREGGGWGEPDVAKMGTVAGGELYVLGFLANENKPKLKTFDSRGNRIDEVEFHPAYHRLMDASVSAGLAGAAWADPRPGAHVARAAGFMLATMLEAGHLCPVSMTYAVVPALRPLVEH